MKTLKLSIISCLTLLFFFASANLSAQKANEKIDKNTLILIKHKGEKEKVMTEDDVEQIFEDLNINIHKDSKEYHFMTGQSRHHVKQDKAFLGIYSSMHDQGIVVDKVVKNSAAEKAGLLAGDVITSINGYNIRNVLDLKNAMRETKPGSVIKVEYIRGEKTFAQNVTLGRKETPRSYRSSSRYQVDPCKVFIGVYTGSSFSEKGVSVHGVIDNTPAMEANIQKVDIITAIDGMPVKSHLQLRVERDKHNQGDAFEISYIRQGVAQKVTAYFKSCEQQETIQEQPVEIKEEVEELMPTTPAITQPTNNTLKVEGFEAYPNPTFGNIKLNFKADAKPTTIRVIDVTGRVLFNENLNNFDGVYNRDLDVSNGTAGVLTITVAQDGKVFNKNIILLTRA